MKQFTKLSIQAIPVEEAHGGSGARQMLVKPEHVATQFLEAVTKGYLKSGGMFDWHNHPDTDEIFIVTQGEGEYHYRQDDVDEKYEYKAGDVIIAPADQFHKIVARGKEETQGFFIRVKAR